MTMKQIFDETYQPYAPIFADIFLDKSLTVGGYLQEQHEKEEAEAKRVMLAHFHKFIVDHMAIQTGLRNFLKLSTGLALSSVRPDPGTRDEYRAIMLRAADRVMGMRDFT